MSDNSPPQMLEFVIKTADSALKKNSDDGGFIIAKGSALKRLNRIQQAIDTLTPYIEKHASSSKVDKYNISTALYNRACYSALLNRTEPALNDLKRSLELSENVSEDKRFAANDADFEGLRDNPKFMELVKE
jgi:tetratricopeptide (TPR) repeat protein